MPLSPFSVFFTVQKGNADLVWWASMTQREKIITTGQNWTNWSQSAETRVTHRCCKRMGTRLIRPADCPGSPLCQHHCLQPGGTWADSHNFSPGCPDCPSWLTAGGGWRMQMDNYKLLPSTEGWLPNQHPCCYCTHWFKAIRLLSHELGKKGSTHINRCGKIRMSGKWLTWEISETCFCKPKTPYYNSIKKKNKRKSPGENNWYSFKRVISIGGTTVGA